MSKKKEEMNEEMTCACEHDECMCENAYGECSCGEGCECGETCTCGDECMCDDECSCCDDCHCGSDEVEALNKEIFNLKEALLRNQADLQNFKRRKEEETERFNKYKNEELVKELLPIVDNFERAISMDDNDLADEVSKFLAGFKLIYTNTVNVLNKYEVKEIKAEGVEFDPTYHHAVLTDHDENKPAGVVLEVLQKGYMYKDRVIRPAMVSSGITLI